MAARRLLLQQIPTTRTPSVIVRSSPFRRISSATTPTRSFAQHHQHQNNNSNLQIRITSPLTAKPTLNHTRHNSTAAAAAAKPTPEQHPADAAQVPKQYDFGTVKAFAEAPSPHRILIDVREPSEYAEGFIPTAINLPLKTAPDALLLPADEFEDRFGFPKPSAKHEVVFYCRSGVRSSAAAKLAEQAGYERISEYKGSWLDWAAQGGAVGRS